MENLTQFEIYVIEFWQQLSDQRLEDAWRILEIFAQSAK
jgi:hypothetical protein